MSRDHTLAHQAETILFMWGLVDHPLADSEVDALKALLRRLTGNVSAWLIEEAAEQRGLVS